MRRQILFSFFISLIASLYVTAQTKKNILFIAVDDLRPDMVLMAIVL